MKKQINIILSIFAIVYAISCNESSGPLVPTEEDPFPGQVEISFQMTSKSVSNDEIIHAIVTIEDEDGNKVIDSKRVSITYLDGMFICEPIELGIGDYLINGFLVLNAEDEIIGVSPKISYLSDFGDPIDSSKVFFSIQANSITKLEPYFYYNYLTNCQDGCYGYDELNFGIADSIEFYIGVFDSNFELTDAKLKIYSYNGDFIYEQDLTAYDGIKNTNFDNIEYLNKIRIPQAGYSYKIAISKDCYYDYEEVFLKEELRLHCCTEYKGPLMIQLDTCDCRTPSLSTSQVSFVDQNVAVCGGIIDADNITIKERGICFSSHPNPTINDNISKSGHGGGTFESLITGLIENTTYYARAYAVTNCDVMTYGEEIYFNTLENGVDDITNCDGIAGFSVYPSVQNYPDATVNIESYSANDADLYLYDLGDGYVSSETSYMTGFSYNYNSPGSYEIKLAVIKTGFTTTDEEVATILPEVP